MTLEPYTANYSDTDSTCVVYFYNGVRIASFYDRLRRESTMTLSATGFPASLLREDPPVCYDWYRSFEHRYPPAPRYRNAAICRRFFLKRSQPSPRQRFALKRKNWLNLMRKK